ncbi:MAG: hypothetical protein WB760_31780 [Xanthobacteraceae bacterium]
MCRVLPGGGKEQNFGGKRQDARLSEFLRHATIDAGAIRKNTYGQRDCQ